MNNLDIVTFHAIRSGVGSWDALDFIGVFSASFLLPLMFVALVIGAHFMRRHDHVKPREIITHALLAALGGFVLREIIGLIHFRVRPFVALSFEPLIALRFVDSAFPSGHATVAFALAATVLRYDTLWGLIFAVFACLVAWGRVYVGVHYPSDVIAGAVLGVLAVRSIEWMEHYQWNKIDHRLRGH